MKIPFLLLLTLVYTCNGDINADIWSSTSFAPRKNVRTAVFSAINFTSAFADYTSVRLYGSIQHTNPDFMTFYVITDGAVRLWIDDNLVIDNVTENKLKNISADFSVPFAISAGLSSTLHTTNATSLGYAYHARRSQVIAPATRTFRLEYVHFTGPSTLQLYWVGNFTPYQLVPAAALTTNVSNAETMRYEMRERMYNPPIQWGTYNNPTMGDHVHLTSGFAVSTTIVDVVRGEVMGDIFVFRDAQPAITRVGPHSYNGSDYTELSLDSWGKRQCTITIRTSVAGNGTDLLYLAEANGTDCKSLALLIVPTMLWGRAGNITSGAPGTMLASVPGFGDIAVYSASGAGVPFANANTSIYVALPLSCGASKCTVGASTGSPYTIEAMNATICLAALRQTASKRKYGELADAFEAMQTIMAWNTVFTPYEGIVTPVSRGWDFGNGYVIFHWDNELASYMLSLESSSLDLSFSNLIQIVQARTLEGLIPNYASGGRKSYDRTEPQLGSHILKAIYDKWNTTWVVELLFESLLGAHNWTYANRRGQGSLAPSGEDADLVVLGTNPTNPAGDWATNTMQGARYESGLDNSPMYDGTDNGLGPVYFNNETNLMELYDVGMTSFFLMDTAALIDLAPIAGRNDVVQLLQARFNSTAEMLNQHLWNEVAGAYANKLYNGTFYTRISPTSLFPLISGVASDDQALKLVDWVTSPYGFCVNQTHSGPANTSMLIQYWDGSRENCECLTLDCVRDQVLSGYNFVRVEALALTQPPAAQYETLRSFYSAKNNDNLLTTDASSPDASYQFLRVEGYCLPQWAPGLVNLTLWWSATRLDYKVCGTAACAADTSNYTFVKYLCAAYNATGLDNLPCKYGVPSIARSDPAFFDNGYWRGRIWGPHVQLMYWALKQYSHLPEVAAARKILVSQSRDLLLTNWYLFRHINENSNGITGTGEASYSDWFYHWGALPGFISLIEAGYY